MLTTNSQVGSGAQTGVLVVCLFLGACVSGIANEHRAGAGCGDSTLDSRPPSTTSVSRFAVQNFVIFPARRERASMYLRHHRSGVAGTSFPRPFG